MQWGSIQKAKPKTAMPSLHEALTGFEVHPFVWMTTALQKKFDENDELTTWPKLVFEVRGPNPSMDGVLGRSCVTGVKGFWHDFIFL